MSTKNRTSRAEANRNAIAGIRKHLSANPTITLDGVARAPADVIAILQKAIDTSDAALATKAVHHKAVDEARAAATASDAVHAALKTWVVSQYKTAPETLADFGFTPPRRRAVDVATNAAANAKRTATRAARHTMGPRQRADVTGHVVGVTVTPVTAAPAKPATDAPPPAAAPSATSPR